MQLVLGNAAASAWQNLVTEMAENAHKKVKLKKES